MAVDTTLPISGLTSLQAGSFIYRMAKGTDAGERGIAASRSIQWDAHLALAIARDVLVWHNICGSLTKLDQAIVNFGGQEMMQSVREQQVPSHLIPKENVGNWEYAIKFVHDLIEDVNLATILAQWCDEMVEAIAAFGQAKETA